MAKQLIHEGKKISEIYIADTFSKRFLGYMFRKKPHHETILITPCSSIHTYFMKFNIDVLFLNRDMEIVKKIENLEKGRMIMPVKDAAMVIEAEAGRLKNFDVGNKITIM